MINFFGRNVLIWSAILLLATFLRLYGLGLNPIGITHDDELHEIINAKSLAFTGSNVPGVVTGVLTQNPHCVWGDCIYGELESYVLIPWMLIFPLNLILSKLPFVFGSIILVLATGKLFENLSKNPVIGMIVGLMVAINPWAIYFGRTAYPQLVSHLFYILGAYFFTRPKSYKQSLKFSLSSNYRSNLILGSLFSIIASLFYFGAKAILPLIILWGIIYNFCQFKLHHIQFTFLFTLVTSLIIGGYFLILSNSFAGIRLNEIETTRVSLRVERFLSFFSPASLFLTGQKDTDNSYISNHGFYYLMDLPFLILGILAISKNLPNTLFIFSLIAISVLPVAIKTSETSIYSLRAALACPLLSGIIGWGIYSCWNEVNLLLLSRISILKKKYITRIFFILLIALYVLSLTYFLLLYWYRLPKNQAIRWFFHERVLANYITRIQSKNNEQSFPSEKKIIVLTGRPDGIFNTFVFYSGIYNNKNTIRRINNSYLSNNFEYRGAEFTNNCQKITKSDLVNSVILIDQTNPVRCNMNKFFPTEEEQKNTPKIANPKDAGGIFDIINEPLCLNYPKNRYPDPRSIYDFRVESLTDEAFCKKWITNPD